MDDVVGDATRRRHEVPGPLHPEQPSLRGESGRPLLQSLVADARKAGLPETHTFSASLRKTTDKCGCDRQRKLIRFSAHASRAENSYPLAESGLGQGKRINRSEIGGRNPTFSDPSSNPVSPTPFRRSPSVTESKGLLLEFAPGERCKPTHGVKPMFCSTWLNRGSGRRPSNVGSTLSQMTNGLRSSHAFFSHSNA